MDSQNSLALGNGGGLDSGALTAPTPPGELPVPTSAYGGPTPTEAAPLTQAAVAPVDAASPDAALPVPAPKPFETATAAPPVTPPADDAATQRIRAAQNAPTAGGGVAVAAAPRPPAQITAPADNRPGLLRSLFAPRQASAAPMPARAPSVRAPERSAPIQLASAAGLARLAPNGLRRQHDGVDIECLKPALVRLLDKVENHYGKPVVVTSGFRSASRNANARGAKHSLHIYCAAADVQVEGVSKSELAAFMRDLPGRGGVGTYCHTNSVHIDIGPRRDWNWRCRR